MQTKVKYRLVGLVLCAGLSASGLTGCTVQLRPEDRELQQGRYRVTAVYEGIAGIYGHGMTGMGTMQSMPGMHGRHNMLGELWDPKRLTVAHRSWPAGTLVRVTNLDNGRSAVARVADRIEITGKSRLCDLSPGLAAVLDVGVLGRAKVRVEILEPADQASARHTTGKHVKPAGKYVVICGGTLPKDMAEALGREVSGLLEGTEPILIKRGNKYVVVVLSTDDPGQAEKVEKSLKAQGYEAHIENRAEPGR